MYVEIITAQDNIIVTAIKQGDRNTSERLMNFVGDESYKASQWEKRCKLRVKWLFFPVSLFSRFN